jgi:deazaflavin-dependent oxidoreductase (nitroreductase family)
VTAHSAQRRSDPRTEHDRHPRLGRRVARLNRTVGNKVMIHLAGLLPGFGIIIHVGRRTRTVYRTPVNVFRTKDGYRVALTYGRESDWVQNALSHGAVRLVTRRCQHELSDPEIVTDPDRQHVPVLPRAMLALLRVDQFVDFTSPG